MAAELPYAQSSKNISTLFEKIKSAKIPDIVNQTVIYSTFGLKSVADRSFISLLKKMEFLDPSGKPTNTYSLLKNDREARVAIANGIKVAYAPLFSANENAFELTSSDLKGLVAQVTGADDSVVQKITATFSGLCKCADFKIVETDKKNIKNEDQHNKIENKLDNEVEDIPLRNKIDASLIKGGFHFNIQIHLPSNGTEETYINIFSAVRKVF